MKGLKFKKWIFKDSRWDPALIEELYQDIHPIILEILSKRLKEPKDIKTFLEPTYENLDDPFKLPQVYEACERLKRAIQKGETIFIHGDFDVDGVTSLSLIYRNLIRLGSEKILPYIPNRFDEGYGISQKGIERALKVGANLFISLDVGTKSMDEIETLKKNGIDVIVIDHHLPEESLLFPFIMVNPKITDYLPYHELAGVGVTFKFLQAFYRYLGRNENPLLWDLDLVAIGTLADLVPLLDESRKLVKLGTIVLNKTKKTGIKALYKVAKIYPPIKTFYITHIISPRLNASGRLSTAHKAFKLLITTKGSDALELAKDLELENRLRQKIENHILSLAIKKIEREKLYDNPIILVSGENFHEGVIGIVASKLVELYSKPAVVISEKTPYSKGSARSVSGFDIYNAFKATKDYLVSFGGHSLACGFKLKKQNIQKFYDALLDYCKKVQDSQFWGSVLELDGETDIKKLNSLTTGDAKKLEPIGPGNPQPVFLLRDCKIFGEPKVINEQHLVLKIEKKNEFIKVFAPEFVNYLPILSTLKNNSFNLAITFYWDETYSKKTKFKLLDLSF